MRKSQFRVDSISIISLRISGENNVKAFSNIRTPTVKIKPKHSQTLKYSNIRQERNSYSINQKNKISFNRAQRNVSNAPLFRNLNVRACELAV